MWPYSIVGIEIRNDTVGKKPRFEDGVSRPDDGENSEFFWSASLFIREGTRKLRGGVTQSLALGALAPPTFGLNVGKKDISRRIGSEHVVKLSSGRKAWKWCDFSFLT